MMKRMPISKANVKPQRDNPRLVIEPVTPPFAGWKISLMLGLGAALLVLLGINYHGLTYDEPIYAGFGLKSAKWLVGLGFALFDGTFFQHLSADTINKAWFAKIDMQPPIVQVLSGLSNMLFGGLLGGLLPQRLPTALFFGLTIGLTFWLTERAFNRPAAFFAACALLLLPRFFGDAHFTTLDVPVSALILLTAVIFYVASADYSWSTSCWAGVCMGLALLTKLNAGFLIIFLLLWAAVFHRPMILRGLVAFGLVTPLVFLAGWPWLWHDTAQHLHEYLFFHLQHYPVLVYYFGQYYKYAPWHYPFVLTAFTVPTVVLLLMLVGLGYGASGKTVGKDKPLYESLSARWLLIICGIGYLLPSALPFAPKYNGVRLFLPAFPFLLGLAGGGFALIYALLARRLERIPSLAAIPNFSTKFAVVLTLALLVPSVVGLMRVYPYEHAYYNALAGGPAGATAKGLETIYWGDIYNASFGTLNALPQETPRILVTPQGVTSLLETYQRGGALRPNLNWASPPPPAQQKAGWPKRALKDVDWVVFQCAQSEFDQLAWQLYKNGAPEPGSKYLDDAKQVPLLLVFSGDEARRVVEQAKP